LVPVFYGTNRVRVGTARYGSFTAGIGPVRYGVAYVTIPPGHEAGEIERPAWICQRLGFGEDAERHVTIRRVDALGDAAFFQAAGAEMARIASKLSKPRTALLFVHGFNVRFDDAVMRTAQIAKDVGFQGAPFLFSWPSQGAAFRVRDPAGPYRRDARSITLSQAPLEGFIRDVLDRAKPDKLFILAHSMGARGTSLALSRLAKTRPDLRQKVAALVLAAPDIQQEVFRRDVGPGLARLAAGVTTYSSSRDKALMVSHVVNGRPALGDARGGPFLLPPMQMVDVSAIDTDWLGHSAYGNEAPLLADIRAIVNNVVPPRAGLQRRARGRSHYWAYMPQPGPPRTEALLNLARLRCGQ
jgi:esterase/lipase superfamily enzyme